MTLSGAEAAALGTVASVVIGLGGAWLARRGTADAARSAAESGAFQRATEIYEAGAEEMRKQLLRIAADHQQALERIERLESTATDLRSTASDQAEEIRTLRRSVSIYEGRVQQLEAALRVLGAEVPPWNLLPGDADLLGTRTPMDDPNRPPRTEP